MLKKSDIDKDYEKYRTRKKDVKNFVSAYNSYSNNVANAQSALQKGESASSYLNKANNDSSTLNFLMMTSAVKDYLGKDYNNVSKYLKDSSANLTYFDLANRTDNYAKRLRDYASNYTKGDTYASLDSENAKLSDEINQAAKKYTDNKEISSALSRLLSSLQEGKAVATERNNLYSQFETVDDYNKAKRSYDLESKFAKKYEAYDTPEKLEAYLKEQAKGTTLIPGKQGLTYAGIDTDEAEYVKNKMNQVKFTKYNGMSIKELEAALEDLENKKSNAKKEWLNAGKKSKEVGYTTDEQKQARHRWESIITQTDYIKTIIAQKEQEEYFNNQWGFRYKQFAGAPLVVNNDEGDYNGAKEDKIMALIRTSPTNDDQFQRDIMQTSQVTGSDPDTYARVKEMTDEEKTVFANLYRKDKKEALKYFEALNKTYLDSRLSTTIQTQYANWAKQNGWTVAASAVLSPLYTIAGAFEAPISLATGNRSIAAAKKQGMQAGAKSTWANSQNADLYDFLYDTGTSMIDSGVVIATTAMGVPSWAGTAMLGASAASSTYNDLLDRGVDRTHAAIGAILAGTAEGFFEKFSVEQLKAFSPSSLKEAIKQGGKKGLAKAIALNLAKQSFTEGSEELATEIANIITDSIVQGDLSNPRTSFVNYINQGMSEQEAKKQVAKDLGNQVLLAAAGGALSGLAFGAGGAVMSGISANVSASQVGANVKQNLDGFKQLAQTSNISDDAKNTIASLTNKSSNINVGFAAQQAFLQMSENSVNQISAELQKSGMDAKTANRTAREIVSSTFGTDTNSKYLRLNLFANQTVNPILQNFINGQYGGDTLENLYNMAYSGNVAQGENITAETEKTQNTPQIQSEAGVAEGETVTPTENITASTKGVSKFTADRTNIDTATANESADVKELVERKQAALNEKIAENPRLQGAQLHFVDKNTRSALESIADRLGVDLEFTNDMADGKYSNGKISISVVGERPIALTFAHELIHYLQESKGYTQLESYIFQEDAQGDAENATFRDWLVKNGFANLDEAIDTYAENYADVYDTTADNFDSLVRQEIVADFIADTLLTDYGDENIDVDFMEQLRKDDRNLFQKIIDFFKKLFTASKGTQFEQDVRRIYDRLNGLLKNINKETSTRETTDEQERYSYGYNKKYQVANGEYKSFNALTEDDLLWLVQDGSLDYLTAKRRLDRIKQIDKGRNRREQTKLKDKIDDLRKEIKKEKTVNKGDLYDSKALEDTAKKLIKFANSDAKVKTVKDMLQEFTSYLYKSNYDTETAKQMHQEIIDTIMAGSDKNLKVQPSEASKELLDFLKNHRIAISQTEREEFAYKYDNYRNFRNLYRILNLIDRKADSSTMSIDEHWGDLKYLTLNFEDNLTVDEMWDVLLDAVDQARDGTLGENTANIGDERQAYFEETLPSMIIDELRKTEKMVTFADKKKAELQQYKEKQAAKEESKRVAETKEQLSNIANSIETLLGTNSKTKNVKPELVPLASATSKAAKQLGKGVSIGEALSSVVEQYEALGNEQNVANEYVASVLSGAYSEDTLNYLKSIVGSQDLKGLSVDDLNSKQYKDVKNVFAIVQHTINKANTLFGENKKQRISAASNDIYEEVVDGREQKYETSGLSEKVKKWLYEALEPSTVFNLINSRTLSKLVKDLTDNEQAYGILKHNDKQFLEDLVSLEKMKEWQKKKVKVKTQNGTIEMTVPQAMLLYATANREQGRKHLINDGEGYNGAGFDVTLTEKGKVKLGHKFSSMSEQNITDLIDGDVLTEEQKTVTEKLVKYLSTVKSEQGNAASRQLVGIDLFDEPYYIPLNVEEDTSKNENNATNKFKDGVKKIKNMGFTNAVDPNANAGILIGDIFDVFAKHCEEMNRYSAFAVPLENLERVMNYKDSRGRVVKQALDTTLGKNAYNYITKFIEDVNGGKEAPENILAKLVGNTKGAAVGFSLSTAIQQSTAIYRAMAMVDPKYFAKGAMSAIAVNKSWRELLDYSGIGVVKDEGGFDVYNKAQASNYIIQGYNSTAIQNIKDASGFLAEFGDKVGWTRLWEACKRETADKYNLDVNSKECLEKAAKRFNDVVLKTQVYNSVFSKSGFMRSKSSTMQQFSAFKGEPTKVFNMAVNSILDLKRGKITPQQFVRTQFSIFGSIAAANARKAFIKASTNVGTAAFDSLILGMVGRKDDEDKEKNPSFAEEWLTQFVGNLLEDLRPWNSFPFLSDIGKMVEGFNPSRMETQNMFKAIQEMQKVVKGITEGDGQMTARALLSSFEKVFDTLGIPASNIEKSLSAIYGAIVAPFDDALPDDLKGAAIEGLPLIKKVGKELSVWGQPQSTADRLLGKDGYDENSTDVVNKEIARLYESVNDGKPKNKKDKSMIPQYPDKSFTYKNDKISLDEDQYKTLLEKRGTLSYNLIKEALSNKQYKSLSDEQKVDFIGKVYSYATAKAKTDVSAYELDDQFDTVDRLEKVGISPVDYFAYKVITQKEYADTDGSGGVSDEEKEAALKAAEYPTDQSSKIKRQAERASKERQKEKKQNKSK